MSFPLAGKIYTGWLKGYHNVERFYIARYTAWNKPNFYPLDYEIRLRNTKGEITNEDVLETSNVEELLVDPFKVTLAPEQWQIGHDQWGTNTAPSSGMSNFYPQITPTDGASDFYPQVVPYAYTFYPQPIGI